MEYEYSITLETIQQRIPDAVEILCRAIRLHVGWEMDNEICAVLMRDGSRIIVGTSHGGIYEEGEAETREKLALYQRAISETESVLSSITRRTGCGL